MKKMFILLQMVLLIGNAGAQSLIDTLEYFIDTDPGYGRAINVPITLSAELDMKLNPDISSLPDGIHTSSIRCKRYARTNSYTKNHTFYRGSMFWDTILLKLNTFLMMIPDTGTVQVWISNQVPALI